MTAAKKKPATKKKAPAKKKSTTKKKSAHGGKRKGAGRPKGSGTGTGKHARINRVVVMLSNAELAELKLWAKGSGLPLGTEAYQILATSLDVKVPTPSKPKVEKKAPGAKKASKKS